MAGNRRGLMKERHTIVKLAVAGLSAAGFAAAWAGFAASHQGAAPDVAASETATATTVPPAGTSAATPTRGRRSRGS